jgi:hypothetical protein
MGPPAAVLFDLYDTLVHASADNAFYRAVPAALGVSPDRWLTCYRALGPASMRGEVPDLTSRVYLACRHAGQPRDRHTVASVVDGLLPVLYAGIRPDREARPVLDGWRSTRSGPARPGPPSSATAGITNSRGPGGWVCGPS